MTYSANREDLVAQVSAAVDPDGDIGTVVDLVTATPAMAALVGAVPGVSDVWSQLSSLAVEHGAVTDRIVDALIHLVPRGWAVFRMDKAAVDEAVRLVKSGRGEVADELLADQWDGEGSWRTKGVCDRVGVLGVGESTYKGWFGERARLLRLAKADHEANRFHGSILTVYAQIEGIAIDVTNGKKFFTKTSSKADVVDPGELAAIAGCLGALQVLYARGLAATQADGSLSRHGVMHGRELAFDNRQNSAKVWSVLDAVVTWARPRAQREAQRRRAERDAEVIGRSGVDATGKRTDDREFTPTRNVLWLVSSSAMGFWRRSGRFRDDIITGVYSNDFVSRGLPREHGLRCHVSHDGQAIWFWRTTVSGWTLGIGVVVDNDALVDRYYSAPGPPAGPPGQGGVADGWAERFAVPADWRG